MTPWQTRTRGRGQTAVRGPHEHGPGGLEIPESRKCGGAGTGTPSMAGACRVLLGSVFGFEGFRRTHPASTAGRKIRSG